MRTPKLTKTQIESIKLMKQTTGWDIVKQMIEVNIKMKNAGLINFEWKFDDNGEPTKKSVMEFKDIQKESTLLKKILLFIDKPVIIQEKKENDVYA